MGIWYLGIFCLTKIVDTCSAGSEAVRMLWEWLVFLRHQFAHPTPKPTFWKANSGHWCYNLYYYIYIYIIYIYIYISIIYIYLYIIIFSSWCNVGVAHAWDVRTLKSWNIGAVSGGAGTWNLHRKAVGKLLHLVMTNIWKDPPCLIGKPR